jgi:hypothetical protein
MNCLSRFAPPALRVTLALTMVSASAVSTAGPAAGAPANGGVPGCSKKWSAPKLLGRLPGSMGEVSGFVSSPVHRGVAWMIRDSGHAPALYSFRLDDGSARVKGFPIRGAGSRDWEDIAYTAGPDGKGRLWILDNIHRKAKEKFIYEVVEPDLDDTSAKLVRRYRWSFPDGRSNAEVLFALDGKLHVVNKSGVPALYRFDSPLSPSRLNKPDYKGKLPVGSAVTLASTSADQRLLVTSSTRSDRVWVQESSTGLSGFLTKRPVFSMKMVPAQREGGDFYPYGSCDIILLSEHEGIYRLSNS